MKHIFIVNPVAGTGNAEEKLIPQIKTFLRNADFDFEIHRSLNKAEIGSYCRQRASKEDDVRFYACGGDGTVNDVVNGIYGFENAQLAIIPCGSGNDFVRNFSNKENFFNIEKQTKGNVELVDLIKMTTESGSTSYAINMLNIGTDCDVAFESSEMKRLPLVKGSGSYALAAMKILPEKRVYRLQYENDGLTYTEDTMLCAVANGRYCGGGFKSCPKANLTDGLMDIAVVYPIKGPKLVQMLLKYHEGKHLDDKNADKYVKYFKANKFKLSPVSKVNVCIDGECIQFESTEFEILPKGIKVVVPEGSQMI